jgi:D-amino-acid dehydrogenase
VSAGDQGAVTPAPGPTSTTVAVIGAGIVGVCIAYELRKRGADVVLVDRDEPGNGASFGNSGAISPSSVVPLAMPGVLASVPQMLRDPEGALYLPLGYLPRALPWLMQFVASARPAHVERSAARLLALHRNAVGRHVALADEVGVPELVLQRGHLHLYTDANALAQDDVAWRMRAERGFEFERLDRHGIEALEPAIGPRYRAGIFLADHATIVNPYRYLRSILQRYVEHGGTVRRAEVRRLSAAADGSWRIDTADGPLSVRHAIVAAGAWSRRLLDPLGIRLSLETQRGYHAQFKCDRMPVSRTVVLTDRKVFVTPMEEGLRVGGTVEIAGLARPPDPRRAALLVKIARENFTGLADASFTEWMGHRPCMPDSVPVVGAAAGRPGLWLAVGHGHLGLTDSPGTAQLIADALLPGAAGSGAGVV